MRIAIIAAMSKNRVIGLNNQIPWHISADFKRVKQLTTGNTIIMGRKTFDSIGKALPNRTNIVLTQQENFDAPGCIVAKSLEEAFKLCRDELVFIFGGNSLYQKTLPIADEMYLTLVDADIAGDTYFPEWDKQEWSIINQSNHTEGVWNYQFIDLQRSVKI